MMIRMMTSIVPSDMTRSPKARGRPQNATAARIKAYSGPRVLSSDPPKRGRLRFSHKGRGKGGLFLRLVDRQHLERRCIGLDAEAIAGDQADLVQRGLFEIAAGGFAHRVLPRAPRALGDQHFCNTDGV